MNVVRNRRAINDYIEHHLLYWETGMASIILVYLVLWIYSTDHPSSLPPDTLLLFIPVFAAEFLLRLWAAPSRRSYAKQHWIDLAACIPPIGSLRLFLIVRPVFLGLRVVLATGRIRGRQSFPFVVASSILLWAGCSYLGWVAERGTNPQFRLLGNAFWWGIQTITTLGYGDVVPITWEGRVIGGLLAVLGIGVIGVVASQVTTLWMSEDKQEEEEVADLTTLLHNMKALQAEVAEIKVLLQERPSPSIQSTPGEPAAGKPTGDGEHA